MYMHVCGTEKLMSSVFFYCFPTDYLRQSLPKNLQLIYLVKITGQQSLLFPCLHGYYRHKPPLLNFSFICDFAQKFPLR